jgi:hypothetical protein
VSAPHSAEAVNEIQNQRNDNTQQQGGRQRKVNYGVCAAIGEIARQAAKRQIKPACHEQYHAQEHNQAANHEQELTEITHANILAGRTGRCFEAATS